MLSDSADPALSHPITGIGCCAGAANGQASAQPAMRARNSRRRICPFFAKSGAERLADALRRFLEKSRGRSGCGEIAELGIGLPGTRFEFVAAKGSAAADRRNEWPVSARLRHRDATRRRTAHHPLRSLVDADRNGKECPKASLKKQPGGWVCSG